MTAAATAALIHHMLSRVIGLFFVVLQWRHHQWPISSLHCTTRRERLCTPLSHYAVLLVTPTKLIGCCLHKLSSLAYSLAACNLSASGELVVGIVLVSVALDPCQ